MFYNNVLPNRSYTEQVVNSYVLSHTLKLKLTISGELYNGWGGGVAQWLALQMVWDLDGALANHQIAVRMFGCWY